MLINAKSQLLMSAIFYRSLVFSLPEVQNFAVHKRSELKVNLDMGELIGNVTCDG